MREPELVRAIGRWSLVALTVNSILGSAVFGLPSVIAAAVGSASPWTVLLTGAVMAVIVACYAEVASQFTDSGGTYLYVRWTFGRLAGLLVSWLNVLTRLTAGAAAVNLFVTYLAGFLPDVARTEPRCAIVTLLVGGLAMANYRGVGAGTRLSDIAVVAKLLPLGVVCVLGVIYLGHHTGAHDLAGSNLGAQHSGVPVAGPPASAGGWLTAMLLLFFAYGGYEVALNPMGEAADPRRDAPFALFVALVVITVLYTLVQLIVVQVLPDPANTSRPLADVAHVLIGPAGAVFISLGALISVYGYLSANMLGAPRSIYAPAERADFPRWLAAVHPRFRTPYVAIAMYASLLWLFALFGSFSWNVTLSAVGRLCYYAAVCAAVPVLRRRQPGAARFRVPGGLLLPALGVVVCLVLLTQVDFSKSLILAAAVGVAVLNWLVVRNRGAHREHG